MLRNFFIAFILGIVAVAALAGFRDLRSPKSPLEIFPDMKNQPRYDPQHPGEFYADGRSARVPVAGTVPIGYELPGSYLQNAASNSKHIRYSVPPEWLASSKILESVIENLAMAKPACAGFAWVLENFRNPAWPTAWRCAGLAMCTEEQVSLSCPWLQT